MPSRTQVRTEGTHFSGQQPQAVQRALGMLEAVAHLGPGTTAKEIARFAGVPPATAYRMLNLLVAEGFLVRVPDLSGFALGRRTARSARAAADTGTLPSLHEAVEELRSRTRFAIHVASFAGGRLRIVDRDPDHEIAAVGMLSKHLHANALGKLMLAYLPDVHPEPDLRRLTEFTICDLDELTRHLRAVVLDGFAHECQESRIGRAALAVPLRDRADHVVGGLYLHGADGRVQPDRELIRFLADGAEGLTGMV